MMEPSTTGALLPPDEHEDLTVGTLCDSIETNLWLAEAYLRRGSDGLALECLRAAWLEYVRFRDVLRVYTGSDALGERLVRALTERAGPDAAGLALGDAAPARVLH